MAVPGPTTACHVEAMARNLVRLACVERQLSPADFCADTSLSPAQLAALEDGSWQPTLPELSHILANLDYELRISLGDYDSHDDVLHSDDAQRTEEQRADDRARQDVFLTDLRQSRSVH